jgi:hypothetical protein
VGVLASLVLGVLGLAADEHKVAAGAATVIAGAIVAFVLLGLLSC